MIDSNSDLPPQAEHPSGKLRSTTSRSKEMWFKIFRKNFGIKRRVKVTDSIWINDDNEFNTDSKPIW